MMNVLAANYRNLAKTAVLSSLGIVHKTDQRLGKTVLLTFDDGPHPDVTPMVLERLRRHRALALFFVVGNRIPLAPAMLGKTLADGHLIGNHTFQHWLGRSPWPMAYARDLANCQKAIRSLTGYEARFFRPPMGSITLGSFIAAQANGLRTVHWSVDSGDWRLRTQDEAVECGEQLSQTVEPGDILLFHDNKPCVLPLLDVLLPSLVSRGFDLCSALTQLSNAPAA